MRLRQTTALIACLATLVAAGCGSSGGNNGKPIPVATRVELDKRLNSIENRFNFGGGACADIAKDKALVQSTLDGIPSDVDSDVKKALVDGFDKLFQDTDSQCNTSKGQQTDTQTTESTPAPAPTPTETQPTPTETTPQQTTTTPAPKKPKAPKSNGNGNGKFDSNGGGKSVPQSGTGGGGTSPGNLP